MLLELCFTVQSHWLPEAGPLATVAIRCLPEKPQPRAGRLFSPHSLPTATSQGSSSHRQTQPVEIVEQSDFVIGAR
jgi:hypothetical protein